MSDFQASEDRTMATTTSDRDRQIADLRDAARGAGVTVIRVEVRDDGLGVFYGDRRDLVDADQAYIDAGGVCDYWVTFGPSSLAERALDVIGRAQGVHGRVVPSEHVTAFIESLRREWRERYARERRRWAKVRDWLSYVTTFVVLTAAPLLAVAGAGAARAGEPAAAAYLFLAAVVCAYCAPSAETIPDALKPPGVTA